MMAGSRCVTGLSTGIGVSAAAGDGARGWRGWLLTAAARRAANAAAAAAAAGDAWPACASRSAATMRDAMPERGGEASSGWDAAGVVAAVPPGALRGDVRCGDGAGGVATAGDTAFASTCGSNAVVQVSAAAPYSADAVPATTARRTAAACCRAARPGVGAAAAAARRVTLSGVPAGLAARTENGGGTGGDTTGVGAGRGGTRG